MDITITERVFKNTPPIEGLRKPELFIRLSSSTEEREREAIAAVHDLDYANPSVEIYTWDDSQWRPTSASVPFPENGYQVGDDLGEGVNVLEVAIQEHLEIE